MGDGVRKTIDRSSVSPLKEKFEGPVNNEGVFVAAENNPLTPVQY